MCSKSEALNRTASTMRGIISSDPELQKQLKSGLMSWRNQLKKFNLNWANLPFSLGSLMAVLLNSKMVHLSKTLINSFLMVRLDFIYPLFLKPLSLEKTVNLYLGTSDTWLKSLKKKRLNIVNEVLLGNYFILIFGWIPWSKSNFTTPKCPPWDASISITNSIKIQKIS